MIADKYIKCNFSSGHVIRIMTNNFETYKRQLAETSTLVEMRLDMLHFFNKRNELLIKQQGNYYILEWISSIVQNTVTQKFIIIQNRLDQIS